MITICHTCHSYWTVAAGTAEPKACPFCGTSLTKEPSDDAPETLEQCLAWIVREFGADCLLNRRKTFGLFSDLAPSLRSKRTLLKRFYDVNGCETYFDALKKTPGSQRAAFELVVTRLTTEQFLTEEAARAVCSVFWSVISGTKAASGTIRVDQPRKTAQPEVRTKHTAHSAVPNPTAAKAEELYEMGYRYEFGKSVSKNPKLAAQLYRKAADLGHSGAQRRLGWCYETGNGVLRLEGEAAKWYLSAAKQGDAAAQFLAARCYANGIGVRKDLNEALRWCRLSAEQGYAQAKTLLKKLMKQL